jgi:hypothetical protein
MRTLVLFFLSFFTIVHCLFFFLRFVYKYLVPIPYTYAHELQYADNVWKKNHARAHERISTAFFYDLKES